MANELVAQQHGAVAIPEELSVEQVLNQVQKIQQLMSKGMKPNEHYGVIPGTARQGQEGKPTLLKPGAEKLCLMFRLSPGYQHEQQWLAENHLIVVSTCTLTHIPSGRVYGTGTGLCSTKESKYAFRKAARACPACGQEQIRRSNNPGEGWYCWRKMGGCGAQYSADDARITSQAEGRVANEDIADQWNTIFKMADKRALVAAVLNATAASDCFTQDLEDITEPAPAVLEIIELDEPQQNAAPVRGNGPASPPQRKPAPRPKPRQATLVEAPAAPKEPLTSVETAAEIEKLIADTKMPGGLSQALRMLKVENLLQAPEAKSSDYLRVLKIRHQKIESGEIKLT